jgi:hypothetical protein
MKDKLTAKPSRTQRRSIVFVKEFLCALCVFAVKMVFMVEHCQTDQSHRSGIDLPATSQNHG